MPSPALDTFTTEIDSLSLSKEAKDALKLSAESLYISSVVETADHVERHLDVAIKDNPKDDELKIRAELIRTWLELVRLDGDNLALAIHDGLET